MNLDQFWRLIDSVHVESGGDMDQKCKLLKGRLSSLKHQDLMDFTDHFDAADVGAYTWALWDAAFVIHGGCSDDSFSDFRATLISYGRTTYQAALEDPESLAKFDASADLRYEGFQYVMHTAAETKLGEIPKRTLAFPAEPAGEESDEETLDQKYPKLAARSAIRWEKKPWWKIW